MQAMEAERQPTEEYQEPKGLTAKDLLTLAGSMSLEKGEGFGSLARGAAGILEAREGRKREAQKLNREINAANRKLNTAVAQQRLAYATGDRQAKEAADRAVAEARFEVRKLQVATELKSREVGAKEMAARQRGEARVELTPYQRSQILKDVTKEVDDNTGIKAQLARVRDTGAREQLRQQIIKERYDQAVAAAEGRTLPATSGASATTPGAAPTLSPADRALIEKYQ
jgi:hypothetical protein